MNVLHFEAEVAQDVLCCSGQGGVLTLSAITSSSLEMT